MLAELKTVGKWFTEQKLALWNFDEIEIDETTKSLLKSINIDCFRHSMLMKQSNNNQCHMPSQYILYALKLWPFVKLVLVYIEALEKFQEKLTATEFKAGLANKFEKSKAADVYSALDSFSQKNFINIFQSKSDRLNAKDPINGNDGKESFRDNSDFMQSIILAALPVPNVSSAALAAFILKVCQNEAIYRHLIQSFGSHLPPVYQTASGDELLFKVISSLGWIGKLDAHLGNAQTADHIDIDEFEQIFILRPTEVVGNNGYWETPVHYSSIHKKFIFLKKNLVTTSDSFLKISGLISRLWDKMCIVEKDGSYEFVSIASRSKSSQACNGGSNLIIYGAPGTGKSHRIHNILGKDAEKTITVFHPDTQHSDFVGALKPQMELDKNNNSMITYRFVPGPFTIALVKALSAPEKTVCLIIEEINRASAAAVFGELFQLLDRERDGASTYRIDATDPGMIAYINFELSSQGSPQISKLYLPANLSLFATMNSSDQAVMPLDTAFKRRWQFEYLPIDFENNPLPQTKIPIQTTSGSTSVYWADLAQSINQVLLEYDVPEDRLIGPFFLNSKELETPETATEAIGGKLFIYLWDDVLRHVERSKIFMPKYKTFGALAAAFRDKCPVFSHTIEQHLMSKGEVQPTQEA